MPKAETSTKRRTRTSKAAKKTNGKAAKASKKTNGKAAVDPAVLAEKDAEIRRLTNFKENLSKHVQILGERLALSESIVRNIPEPMITVDLDGRVIYANEACCEFVGKTSDQIENQLDERQVLGLPADAPSILEECLRTEEPVRQRRIELDTDTGHVVLIASATPRRTSIGEIKGAFAIYQDVTEQVRMMREKELTAGLVDAGERVIEVHSSASQISAAAQQQVTTATEQTTTVSQISATVAELASSAKQVAESCAAIADSSNNLLASAKTGQELVTGVMSNLGKVQDMTKVAGEQIFGLSDKSRRVTDVVDLIHAVAAETKLIAFNAAIEAARAGEAGRGFGVVASEVKSLAESVAESGTEIKSLVGDIQAAINRSVLTAEGQTKLVEEVADMAATSSDSFAQIVSQIEQVADRASVISASTSQQRNATTQLTVSMEELSRAATHTAAAAKQTMAAVAQLTSFAEQLGAALEKFKHED